MQKSKMILSITLVFLSALAMTPLNVSAQTSTITFTRAMVTLEDGSIVLVDYAVTIDGTDHAVGATGYTTTWAHGSTHTIKVPTQVQYAARYYYYWRNTGEEGWSGGGNVAVSFTGLEPGKFVFQFVMETTDVTVNPNYKRAGPEIDVFRGKVIRGGPDAQLYAMMMGLADVWSSSSSPMDLFWRQLADTGNLMRPYDIDNLLTVGFTETMDAAFHTSYIGFNIRPLDQQWADPDHTIPRRTDTTIWPLADVNFRHALVHCYDQETIVASIYGYTAIPIRSLVPNAYGGWRNPSLPTHPYNPGDPFATTMYPDDHSSCGILRQAGYVFVDADDSGTITSADYWTDGVGGPKVPLFVLRSPIYATAPASAEHAARFVTDLADIGLAATAYNGYSGFKHEPAEFADYMDKVDAANFDAYMAFWSLGGFPNHLYDMTHSSQICGPAPEEKGKYNHPGINDPVIDSYVETVHTSLDQRAKVQAAWSVQARLYDETASKALGYMFLCQKIHLNAFNPDLRGLVKSPGVGSDNYWTYMNMHWAAGSAGEAAHTLPDGTKYIDWIWSEPPERMNPCYASTVYACDIMSKTINGLIMVNPYSHENLPWLAESWQVVVTPSGPGAMEITFFLRKDVFWQDGNPYTAYDAKFNWDFLKNNAIPKFNSTGKYIQEVEVIDTHTVKVILSATSQFLIYDLAATAAMLPPNVWGPLDGTGLQNILAYDPSADTDATDMGPWFGTPMGPSTRLFGTGPFVFDYYDPVGWVFELRQFPGYFRITDDIHAQKVEMFHAVGDVNRDGWIDSTERAEIRALYGTWWWMPEYDINCDLNSDGVIDFIDLSLAYFHSGEQREYPVP